MRSGRSGIGHCPYSDTANVAAEFTLGSNPASGAIGQHRAEQHCCQLWPLRRRSAVLVLQRRDFRRRSTDLETDGSRASASSMGEVSCIVSYARHALNDGELRARRMARRRTSAPPGGEFDDLQRRCAAARSHRVGTCHVHRMGRLAPIRTRRRRRRRACFSSPITTRAPTAISPVCSRSTSARRRR